MRLVDVSRLLISTAFLGACGNVSSPAEHMGATHCPEGQAVYINLHLGYPVRRIADQQAPAVGTTTHIRDWRALQLSIPENYVPATHLPDNWFCLAPRETQYGEPVYLSDDAVTVSED